MIFNYFYNIKTSKFYKNLKILHIILLKKNDTLYNAVIVPKYHKKFIFFIF